MLVVLCRVQGTVCSSELTRLFVFFGLYVYGITEGISRQDPRALQLSFGPNTMVFRLVTVRLPVGSSSSESGESWHVKGCTFSKRIWGSLAAQRVDIRGHEWEER